jgi:hypothetical protein
MTEKDADRINALQVMLMQAMLGAISSNVRMVTLLVTQTRCEVEFYLERDDPGDREEAQDVADEFAVLLEDRAVEAKVTVTASDLDWPAHPARVVYRRKEAD